ncbi:MAG TPA: hypothetical protein VNO33_00845 [Kofleriaceae bacterium]|nr:hypothetical protein [Kofleriaceae bacterium]
MLTTTKPDTLEPENRSHEERPEPQPLFKRFQVRVRANVRAPAVPLGRWPIY